MNEVEQQVEKEEEIQIEVIDEEVSQDTQPAQETVASDDELDEYTRGVSVSYTHLTLPTKRIV